MASNDGFLREWEPLTDLLNKIPTKVNNLFAQDILFTCVDIIPEFIAIGTNVGLVYLYNRETKNVQKLKCENNNSKLTCIKLLSTVDYMLACGDINGTLTIYQLWRRGDDTGGPLGQRYRVEGLHTSPLTCLHWASNGLALYSGDTSGSVVCTHIDFYMHLSKSMEILNEAFEVVQLYYCQQHLLISTTYRTCVCTRQEKDSSKWNILQVGQKHRKTLGKFGAVFYKNSLRPKDIYIYCIRPGLRIWVADLNGVVLKTLVFKDIMSKQCYEIPVLNPMPENCIREYGVRDTHSAFGVLMPLVDGLYVTYTEHTLYVLDMEHMCVLAACTRLRRILDVAVHKDEIFVLEGDRSLIRISFKPENKLNSETNTNFSSGSAARLPFDIKEIREKFQPASLYSVLLNYYEKNKKIVSHAMEAVELPPIKRFEEKNFELILKDNDFQDVSQENFDDNILYKHRRSAKTKKAKSMYLSSTENSTASESDKQEQYTPHHINENGQSSQQNLLVYNKIEAPSIDADELDGPISQTSTKNKNHKINTDNILPNTIVGSLNLSKIENTDVKTDIEANCSKHCDTEIHSQIFEHRDILENSDALQINTTHPENTNVYLKSIHLGLDLTNNYNSLMEDTRKHVKKCTSKSEIQNLDTEIICDKLMNDTKSLPNKQINLEKCNGETILNFQDSKSDTHLSKREISDSETSNIQNKLNEKFEKQESDCNVNTKTNDTFDVQNENVRPIWVGNKIHSSKVENEKYSNNEDHNLKINNEQIRPVPQSHFKKVNNFDTGTQSAYEESKKTEEILKEIENKEKLLENILNFEQFLPKKLKNRNPPVTTFQSKENETSKIINFVENKCEAVVDNQEHMDKNDKILKYGPPSGSSQQNSLETPACVQVPLGWKLQELNISQIETEVSDSSLCDWEII